MVFFVFQLGHCIVLAQVRSLFLSLMGSMDSYSLLVDPLQLEGEAFPAMAHHRSVCAVHRLDATAVGRAPRLCRRRGRGEPISRQVHRHRARVRFFCGREVRRLQKSCGWPRHSAPLSRSASAAGNLLGRQAPRGPVGTQWQR